MEDTNDESYDYLFKLLCVGESNVGKTTFLHQYIHDNFANFRSTIGIDIFKKSLTFNNEKRLLLQLWDTAGQERYRSLTKSLFRDSMGFLLLFDVTNESSFLSICDWLTHIDSYTRIDNDLRPPVILVGNKIDLVTHRTVDTLRAQKLANDLRVTYIETSAVTGTNVHGALNILIEQIFDFMEKSMERFYLRTPMRQDPSIRSSITLMDKLNRVKEKSCSCT